MRYNPPLSIYRQRQPDVGIRSRSNEGHIFNHATHLIFVRVENKGTAHRSIISVKPASQRHGNNGFAQSGIKISPGERLTIYKSEAENFPEPQLYQ
jgi:hypothetical protein